MEILRAAPERLVTGESPVLIDEWQRMPYSWDSVRREVDRDPAAGRFLLTGSSAPAEAPTHTGTGRIVTVRMRPLSLAERGLTEPTVSLGGLLSGRRPRAGTPPRIEAAPAPSGASRSAPSAAVACLHPAAAPQLSAAFKNVALANVEP